jgi:large subunit ribosomal protein L2
MTIVKSKPTSPGRRFRVKVSNKDLHKGNLMSHYLQN